MSVVPFRSPDLQAENDRLREELADAKLEIYHLKMTLDGPAEKAIVKTRMLPRQNFCPKCGATCTLARRRPVDALRFLSRQEHASVECETCGAVWLEDGYLVHAGSKCQRQTYASCRDASLVRQYEKARRGLLYSRSERIKVTCQQCYAEWYERPRDVEIP